jgi:hypothetical protein
MSTKGQLRQVENEPSASDAVRRPIKTVVTGRVRTRVWGDPKVWGKVTWTIDQTCLQVHEGETRMSKTYRVADLSNALWGLLLAHRWIRKVERRRKLLRLAFWVS